MSVAVLGCSTVLVRFSTHSVCGSEVLTLSSAATDTAFVRVFGVSFSFACLFGLHSGYGFGFIDSRDSDINPSVCA